MSRLPVGCALILPMSFFGLESRLAFAQPTPLPLDEATRQVLAEIPTVEKTLELSYENPFLHRILGKAYFIRAVFNPSPHGNDLGLAMGEYIASLDLEANPEVEHELQFMYDSLPKELRKAPFKEFRAATTTLYNVQKRNIMTVVQARRDLEAAAERCGVYSIAKPRGPAFEATRQHLHQMFWLATGRTILRDRKSGDQVLLGDPFYVRWRDAIRSYGFVGNDRGQIREVFLQSLPENASLIETGDERGRFRLSNQSQTMVAGLKYLQCGSQP